MNRNLIIVTEHHNGKISPETGELLSFAQKFGNPYPEIILIGWDVRSLADEIAQKTGCAVTLITGEHLGLYNPETYLQALLSYVDQREEICLVLSHTSMGYDLAPAMAQKLHVPCISGIEDICESSFTRSLFGGKIISEVMPVRKSMVLTVLPGAFHPVSSDPGTDGSVTILEFAGGDERIIPLGERVSEYQDSALLDADVIVSAGRGVGKQEHLSLIRDLASLFPRSAIGASRAVCDMGWIDYQHQVGTTGRTVSPKLYIACGISGAIQHVSGMKSSQIIISVNTDPYAAMFSFSHYCIIEDLLKFIPVVLEEYRKPPE